MYIGPHLKGITFRCGFFIVFIVLILLKNVWECLKTNIFCNFEL